MKRQKINLVSAKDVPEYMAKPDIIFIDLRSREEFDEGHIGKAFCLSIEQIEDRDYVLANNYRYVLYCNHGGVSMQAAALMTGRETEIYTLVGGMYEYEIFLRSLLTEGE